jgi:hypothetical protein
MGKNCAIASLANPRLESSNGLQLTGEQRIKSLHLRRKFLSQRREIASAYNGLLCLFRRGVNGEAERGSKTGSH